MALPTNLVVPDAVRLFPTLTSPVVVRIGLIMIEEFDAKPIVPVGAAAAINVNAFALEIVATLNIPLGAFVVAVVLVTVMDAPGIVIPCALTIVTVMVVPTFVIVLMAVLAYDTVGIVK